MIPYARQDVSDADVEAVIRVLRSDFLTQGPVVPAFERAVAAYCGAAEAVATNSGTSALHLACLALGVGPGDRVWTSPNTFVASANCARYCGAEVEFVDIDPRSYNIDVGVLGARLELAARAGRLPKVVIPVHFAGQACEMAPIRALAGQYGFRIIEDASHALGGTYRGEKIGGGRFSDITVFSFHAIKPITTGEGGMAVTNDPTLAARMRRLRSHGVTRDGADMKTTADGPWYYEQLELGFNYRMTDLQAALGLSQLDRLETLAAARRATAASYDAAFHDLPIERPWQHPDTESAWHLYVVRARDRDAVYAALARDGVSANVHYIPVYRHPYHQASVVRSDAFPAMEAYYAQAISLPLYSGLTNAQRETVIEAVRRAVESSPGAAV
jgi:UDP-4-amino-4,6-dideoxy-N-acetyl-beta-L-altrosamine transaminase